MEDSTRETAGRRIGGSGWCLHFHVDYLVSTWLDRPYQQVVADPAPVSSALSGQRENVCCHGWEVIGADELVVAHLVGGKRQQPFLSTAHIEVIDHG